MVIPPLVLVWTFSVMAATGTRSRASRGRGREFDVGVDGELQGPSTVCV
jgi:hypothetical protein